MENSTKLGEEVSYLAKGLEVLQGVVFSELRQLQYDLSKLEEEVSGWKRLALLSALANLGWIALISLLMASN